jgi:hypothetical protein
MPPVISGISPSFGFLRRTRLGPGFGRGLYRSLLQRAEQRLRFVQIARVEPLGEPPVHRSQQFARFALALPCDCQGRARLMAARSSHQHSRAPLSGAGIYRANSTLAEAAKISAKPTMSATLTFSPVIRTVETTPTTGIPSAPSDAVAAGSRRRICSHVA